MAAKIPPCPKVVPVPTGWRRAKPKEITPTVQRAAVKALQQALPIGKLQAVDVGGRLYGFSTEWHYDDHVTKPGKPIWHPGISTVVPVNPPAPIIASQSVRDAQFIQSRYSGDEDMQIDDECPPSEFGGVLTNWLRGLFKKTPPAPAPAPKPAAKPVDSSALMVLGSQVHGDDEPSFCEDVEDYDSVLGADFGDEMADETGEPQFGGFKLKLKLKKPNFKSVLKAPKKIVKAAVRIPKKVVRAPKKVVKAVAKPFRRTSKPAARPAARPTPAKPVARSTPAARQTFSPAAQPSAPDYSLQQTAIEEYVSNRPESVQEYQAEPVDYETPDYSAQEAALDSYSSAPNEESPETADQGSDTYDESAIRGDCIFG